MRENYSKIGYNVLFSGTIDSTEMTEIITNLCSLEGLTQVRGIPSFEFCTFSVKMVCPSTDHLQCLCVKCVCWLLFCDSDAPSFACFLWKLACISTIHFLCPCAFIFLVYLDFCCPLAGGAPSFQFCVFLVKIETAGQVKPLPILGLACLSTVQFLNLSPNILKRVISLSVHSYSDLTHPY